MNLLAFSFWPDNQGSTENFCNFAKVLSFSNFHEQNKKFELYLYWSKIKLNAGYIVLGIDNSAFIVPWINFRYFFKISRENLKNVQKPFHCTIVQKLFVVFTSLSKSSIEKFGIINIDEFFPILTNSTNLS